MSRESVTFPPAMERFASLEEFYESDERRRLSGEADYGIFWWDGEQGYSDTWQVSAIAATGEIYAKRVEAYRRDPLELSQVVLLGKVDSSNPGYVRSDLVLEGWNLVCGESRSLQWAIDRVLAATGEYPPLSILARYQMIGAHVHIEVFMGRVAGSRGRAGELIFREEEWPVFRAGLEAGFGDRLDLVERPQVASG